tara:strand:+ start:751 stop:873 length:123 start_codon:yes stop_codon:yes gene_type:complete
MSIEVIIDFFSSEEFKNINNISRITVNIKSGRGLNDISLK